MPDRSTTDRLRAAGLTATPQRAALLEVLERADDHPDAESLHERVRERHPTVSLSTVYETLDRFAQAGLSSRVEGGEGPTRHEARTEPHVNLVCPACGRVRDVDSPVVGRLLEDVGRAADTPVPDQPVELEAACGDCSSA